MHENSNTRDYDQWVATKSKTSRFIPCPRNGDMADHLFGFQRDLVDWSLRRGRSCLFADTGLGKTPMQVEWARNVASEGRVLMLAPLAVADQTVEQAARWDVDIEYRREDNGAPIVITNYEMLEHFDPDDFVGIVLDESSILKSYTGSTRNAIITAFAETPYKLACTATPAPNDFTELGNHAEFLGVQTRTEMLSEYFVHDGGSTQDWRLKGHAVDAFWRFVCSWGAVVKAPSDLGYDDGGFKLPPLRMHEHVIGVDHSSAPSGMLFRPTALTLSDQRRERKETLDQRIAEASRLADNDEPCLIWCEFNAEADAVTAAIPGAIQVAGSHSLDQKRDRLLGFADGRYRVLVTKPKIAGFGMNWQHCRNMVFVGASHSYEQTYQAIRRCWRFGQTEAVDVHVLRAETEAAIVLNYRRKEADAQRMGSEIRNIVKDIVRAQVTNMGRGWNKYEADTNTTIPEWLVTGGEYAGS